MNSVFKGDAFELKAFDLIKKSIENNEFGFHPECARPFLKQGYYSNVRKKNIIFDISIEFWRPNAERLSILYLIECKDYSTKNVPVDDIEEFQFKVSQIANLGHFVKSVFISASSFQEGAFEIAKNTGMMLIEVNAEKGLNFKLHKSIREFKLNVREENKEMETFLFSIFELEEADGLRKYSKKNIESIAKDLLQKIDPDIDKNYNNLSIYKLTEFMKSEYEVDFDFNSSISNIADRRILGYFDVSKNLIRVDNSLIGTSRFSFVLGHEIGHFILHRDLKINQFKYDKFEDSQFDFMSNKYQLNNLKNWVEWQANEFSSQLILPSISFYARFLYIQKKLGTRRCGHIYLDSQPVNQDEFYKIVKYLSTYFGTSKTSVKYKLESLNLISYTDNSSYTRKDFWNRFRELQFDLDTED